MQRVSATNRQTILIVDDEPMVTELLSLVFRQDGFETRTAYSAESALDLLKSWSPELAIVDICLARMDGIDFALRLREACPACKLLLFSGRTDSDSLFGEAKRAGLEFASIEKPVQPEVLLAAARRLLKQGFARWT
jgi:DNA-binding response OmpR family regulator